MKKALPYLITAAVGLVIALTIICVKDVWHQSSVKTVMQILSDAFLVPGVIITGVGLIIFASNGGVFDMLAYAVRMFFDLFRRDLSTRKYKDFYEYRQAKKDKKRDMGFMLRTGLPFIVLSIIFVIVYSTIV